MLARRWSHYSIVLLSLLGGLSVLFATRHGIGISPDSIAYIGAARNLAVGRGLTLPYGGLADSPLTHFPPFYSMLLAGSALVGMDPLQGARWLQALVFALCMALVGFVLHRQSARIPWAAVAGSLFILVSPVMLTLAIMAWTEMLFLVLSFAAIWLLAQYLETMRWPWLVAAAGLVGMATLTRYSGIALIGTGCLGILVLARASVLQRLQKGFLFGLLSSLPLVLWMARNTFATGTTTGREFAFHPIGRTHLLQALDTVSGWLMVPLYLPGIVKLGIIVLVCGLIGVGLFVQPARQTSSEVCRARQAFTFYFHSMLLLYVIVYGLFLAFSISFMDANTPLDDRILSPVFVTGLLLVLWAVQQIWLRFEHLRRLQLIFAALALLLLVQHAQQGTALVLTSYQQGIGFANVMWHESEIIPMVNSLPDELPVYSNAPDGIYILTGRRTLAIPVKFHATTQKANSDYPAELEMMRQVLTAEGGVVVYLHTLGRASVLQVEELQAQLALQVVSQATDGIIYRPHP